MYYCVLKGLCASELLFDIVCGSKVDVAYVQQERHKSLSSFNTTDDCRTKFAQIIPNIPEPSAILKTLIGEHIRGELKISIRNVDEFIQQCIIMIEKQKKSDNFGFAFNVFLQKDKEEARVLGCQTKCPSCGRLCDVEHNMVRAAIGSKTNKHRCMSGHQLRAMSGFKTEPLFRVCESMNDEDRMMYVGKCITWKEFKSLHPTWSFEVDSQHDDQEWKARFIYIWAKIGKTLCRHFGMKYKSFSIDSQPKMVDPMHFVLVLDGSCSTNGLLWQALIHSIAKFLQLRYDEGNPDDRVTIIVFSDVACIEVFFEKIHPSIVDRLKPKYPPGTNYSVALQRLIQVMHDARRSTDNRKSHIVLMSSGEASYPSADLLELKNTWLKHTSTRLSCIGFGKKAFDFQALLDMCVFVNGDDINFMNPQNQAELDTVYAEIARGEDHVKTENLTSILDYQAIKSKLMELKVEDEEDLHNKLIEAVLRRGIIGGLSEYQEDIPQLKLRKLEASLGKIDLDTEEKVAKRLTKYQTDAHRILEILVRLNIAIDIRSRDLHDDIIKFVLSNGIDAISQFAELIPLRKFAQLFIELNRKITITRSHSPLEEEDFTLTKQIDFHCFNAFDLSYSTVSGFYGIVENNFFETIVKRFIYRIKRQHNLDLINALHRNFAASEKVSLRQLLCSFLLNCSEEVRVKCYQLISVYRPVPLIPCQGGEFFALESYWIAIATEESFGGPRLSTTTRILSCGLESTCKGKSRLLNSLFCTSFEENDYDDSRFFKGTIDMQLVRDFGAPGNHFCIADAHGVVSDVLLEKMAGSFDAIFVHITESSCNLVKHIELIGKLATRLHKRLFVIVRDSKASAYCCNQEVLKLALDNLTRLLGSVNSRRINLCRVPSLVTATQSSYINLYGSCLRDFIFDELISNENEKEVIFQ